MNIAWVSSSLPYLPARGGFKLYGANLISILSRRHRLDLISLVHKQDQQYAKWVRQYCDSVTLVPRCNVSLSRRVANFASGYLRGKYLNYREPLEDILREGFRSKRWDIVHVEGGFTGGLMPVNPPVPMVLSLHDAEALRAQEMLSCKLSLAQRITYTVRKHYEPRYESLVYPRFERCTVVAERDATFNRALVPKANFTVVPYGTDTGYFRPIPVEKKRCVLVFHGHFGYAPNCQAAMEFALQVFPTVRRYVPDALFHLVGADPGEEIQALGALPGFRLSANLDDLRPAICSAQVYVCAIRYGTGMKNKILEAMAMQLPIVCYSAAIVGIDCVPGKHVLVARSPQQFAEYVLDLLRRPERAAELAAAGRQLVEERYSWESRARAYEQIYQTVIDERRAHTSDHDPGVVLEHA